MEYWIEVEPGMEIFVNDMNPTASNTILMIHGWPANNNMFEYQYNPLGEMGYRLIGVDTRGFGNSSKPWSGYDYDRLADDIRHIIDALQLRNITLLGHSTGGSIALRYVARHRGHHVGKLVLCAAAAPSLIKRPNFPYGADPSVVTNIIETAYADRPQMLKNFGDIFFYRQVSEPFSEWFFGMGLQAASWSTIAIARDWLAEELFYDMRMVNIPTLIMHGRHDQVVPYPLGLVQNKGIAGSKLITFENSGHGLFYDEKEKFNHALADFAG